MVWLVLLIMIVIGCPRLALAANSLTVGPMTLLATTEGIGVRASYANDDNANATAILEFKQSSDSTWKTSYPPIIDRRTTLGTANDNLANYQQARGSIVALTPNASYDVRITWVDSDGITGINPVTGSITTAPRTPTTGGTNYYVNSSTGNDANLGTNSSAAWRTMSKALSSTAAGDTINCNGTFGAFTISTSGTAGAFRKLKPESGQTCSISAGSANTITVNGDYWWIQGLTVGASTTNANVLISGHHHIYVTNTTHSDYITSEPGGAGGCCLGAFILAGGAHDIFLLSNSITRTTATCSQEGVSGIGLSGTGLYNIAITDNTITGGNWDAIGNNTNSSFNNLENVDILRNTLQGYYDDGLEMDGGGINVRVGGNTTHSTTSCSVGGNTAISEAGIYVGPMYVWRNYFNTTRGVGLKGAHGTVGYVFFFHNTFVIERYGGGYQALADPSGGAHPTISPPYSKNHVYRNNIFQGNNNNVWDFSGNRAGNSYDYDVLWGNGTSTIISRWDALGDQSVLNNYSTFAAFRADNTNQEAHGQYGNPGLDSNYHITSSSIAYNAGVTLSNFNDANSDCVALNGPPDIGAYEVGGCTGGIGNGTGGPPPAPPTGLRVF